MINVIEQLEAETMKARRDGGKLSSFAKYILSEVRNIGKNKGNRDTTEDEAIQFIKKQVEKTEEVLHMVKEEQTIKRLKSEINFLENLLPEMVSENEILDFLRNETTDDMKKGEIMKKVKNHFGARVDMKKVGQMIK